MADTVDGVDEQDRDHTEEVLAAALVLLLATAAVTAPFLALTKARLSGLLSMFMERSASDLAGAAGLDAADAAQVTDQAVKGLLPQVERHTADWLAEAVRDRAAKLGLGRSEAIGRTEAESAAGMIARTLTTYVREAVREVVAVALGAVAKRWRTRADSHVRPQHAGMENQRQKLGRPFLAPDGTKLQRPGDPAAPLAQIAGCRCRTVFELPA